MNIVIGQTTSVNRPRTHASQARFDKLWQDLKKKQKKNAKFEADIEALIKMYQQQLLPVERELKEPAAQLAERLIELSQRKSLSNWHREELAAWIMETIMIVDSFDKARADQITEQYKQALAKFIGVPLEELEAEALFEPAEFEDMMREFCDEQPFEGDEPPQPDMFGFTHEEAAEEEPADPFGGFYQETDPSPAPARDEQLINGKWIRNLFRRAAQALHPDKETDPEMREHKHQLMSQLLEARDQEDVMTMLTLYSEHVEGGDLAVAEQEAAALCELLENQIQRLAEEQKAYLYEHPYRQMAYDHLYSRTKKGRAGKLKERVAEVRDHIEATQDILVYLRNLNCLKTVLKQRNDERYAMLPEILFG